MIIRHFGLILYSSVIVSSRLVTSPCAFVADSMGYTANVQKLMSTFNLLFCGVGAISVEIRRCHKPWGPAERCYARLYEEAEGSGN